MNYYGARQRKDGRWDYAVENNGNVRPVGYCHAYREWDDAAVNLTGIPADQPQVALAAQFKHKHHADGHATADEACECYR